jgi:hypothetical protein
VIRTLLILLGAFALAVSPVAARGSVAASMPMSDCTMDKHMPAKPADHSKMDCCTPACQITASALLPDRNAGGAPLKSDGALHGRNAVKKLASITLSGLDPPPRLPS